jgi:hypothetical protein
MNASDTSTDCKKADANSRCDGRHTGQKRAWNAIHRHEQMQFAFLGMHLGDVEMEIADRVGLEWLLRTLSPSISGSRLRRGSPASGYVALDLRQPVTS